MMLGMIIMMGQRAAASAERIYEILDEQPTIVDRPGRGRPRRLQGRRALREGRLLLRARPPHGPLRPRPAPAPGRDGGPGGAHRLGQVDRGPAHPPLLRRHRGHVHGRRPRRPGPDAREPARQRRRRARRRLPVLGVDPGQHRLRAPRRRHRRRGGGGARRRGRRVHPGTARGLRHRGGRTRLHVVGRPAPAHHHRPDPARQPAHPGARRRHQRHRRPGRAADPRRAARAHGGADHADRRPPAVDHQPGRPGRPARGRAHRGRRHPRRAARDHAAATPRSWPRSSPTPRSRSALARLGQRAPAPAAGTGRTDGLRRRGAAEGPCSAAADVPARPAAAGAALRGHPLRAAGRGRRAAGRGARPRRARRRLLPAPERQGAAPAEPVGTAPRVPAHAGGVHHPRDRHQRGAPGRPQAHRARHRQGHGARSSPSERRGRHRRHLSRPSWRSPRSRNEPRSGSPAGWRPAS